MARMWPKEWPRRDPLHLKWLTNATPNPTLFSVPFFLFLFHFKTLFLMEIVITTIPWFLLGSSWLLLSSSSPLSAIQFQNRIYYHPSAISSKWLANLLSFRHTLQYGKLKKKKKKKNTLRTFSNVLSRIFTVEFWFDF